MSQGGMTYALPTPNPPDVVRSAPPARPQIQFTSELMPVRKSGASYPTIALVRGLVHV